MKAISKLLIIIITTVLFNNYCFADSKILAVVEDDIITSSEVDQRIEILTALGNVDPEKHSMTQVKLQILTTLVDEKIFTQEAKAMGIDVTKKEIEQAIARLEQNRGLPKGAMIQQLSLKGIKAESVFLQIKNALIWEKILVEYIAPKLEVTEAEVIEFIESNNADKIKIDAYIVSSTQQNEKKMRRVWDNFSNCNDIKNIKTNDLSGIKINRVNSFLQNIENKPLKKIAAMKAYGEDKEKSDIFKSNDNNISFIVTCSKKHSLSDKDLEAIRYQIKLKKVESNSQLYMQNLKKKKFIEIYTSQI